MNNETIIAIVKINDLDLKDLGIIELNINDEKLIEEIINKLKNEYERLPGKIIINRDGEFLIIKYTPEIINQEDQNLFGRAINLLIEKKYNAGKEYLIKLTEKYPLNSDILYNLGMCYSEMGEIEKSIKPLEQAIKVTPFYSNAYVALGVSHSRLGNYEKAIEFELEALKYDPDNFYAYRNLAGCYGKIGNMEKALEFNNKALEIDANDPQSLLSLALIYEEKGNNKEADTVLKKIIDNGINDQIIELAKNKRTKIADDILKAKGIRMDAVMYLTAAMKMFNNMGIDKVREITFAASIMGINGFDINNPDKKYFFKELEKECTGLQMLCYMYAGFKIIDPTVNVGIEFTQEYNMAKGMVEYGTS